MHQSSIGPYCVSAAVLFILNKLTAVPILSVVKRISGSSQRAVGALEAEGEAEFEGCTEGLVDGIVEGLVEGKTDGRIEGNVDGIIDGLFEGVIVDVIIDGACTVGLLGVGAGVVGEGV